jgi:hypothetical protein
MKVIKTRLASNPLAIVDLLALNIASACGGFEFLSRFTTVSTKASTFLGLQCVCVALHSISQGLALDEPDT